MICFMVPGDSVRCGKARSQDWEEGDVTLHPVGKQREMRVPEQTFLIEIVEKI